MIKCTCQQVDGRITVMVGITDSTPEESIALAKTFAEMASTAVVDAPPYYFGLAQSELAEYYQQPADQLPLPLYLYNMPSHTGINIDLATVQIIFKHPNIIGLKDSSANAVYLNAILHTLK